MNKVLDQNNVKEVFNYCPETGLLTWKIRPKKWFKRSSDWLRFNRHTAGRVAGADLYPQGSGKKRYIQVTVFNRNYTAHRIAYLYMTGEWPSQQIDHINGNGADNRWSNIRHVSHNENGKNVRRSESNRSGVTGVFWDKRRGNWRAEIKVSQKSIYLGRFSDKSDAIAARREAEILHGFHTNHGSDRPL